MIAIKKDTFTGISPSKDDESPLRSILHIAKGEPFNPLPNYEAAKISDNGYVVFEGDDGGQIYLTCPMKYVNCNHNTLLRLLNDIDKMFWNDESACRVFYEAFAMNSGVWGGMGGGVAIDGLWIHDSLNEAGLFDRIQAVITGKK